MPRMGELTYYGQIGQHGREHAISKPFSDPDCCHLLIRAGELMRLLPAPPARLLECGCGTGWLAYFLAKRGYQVVATDVSAEAIQLAQTHPPFHKGAVPDFRVADTEQLDFDAEFDVVVFFDSLHHAVDEFAALQAAFRALRPGGRCVMMEPGWGHHRQSLKVEEKYGVTEKDMPPWYLRKLGKKAGFQECRVYPAFDHLSKTLLQGGGASAPWGWKMLTFGPIKYLTVLALIVLGKQLSGVTVLFKPKA
jgi:SAM-dependent methyltransferase